MPLNPIIVSAEQAALQLMMSEPAADIDGQRAQALRIDREIVEPLVADAPDVEIRDVEVPVPGHGTVDVRLFVPPTNHPDGLYLFFFGGAFLGVAIRECSGWTGRGASECKGCACSRAHGLLFFADADDT